MLDGPVQDLHAHVHLRLQLREHPVHLTFGQAVIEGEGLVNLDEMHVCGFEVVGKETVRRIELMRWTALFVDPHRVRLIVSKRPIQLGDVVGNRCRLVLLWFGRRRDRLAAAGDECSDHQQRNGREARKALFETHVLTLLQV